MIQDEKFSESSFISLVDNVFIKLQLAITMDDLESVKHFVNDDVYNKYKSIIDDLNSKNLIRLFDECNVKETNILSKETLEDKYVIKVDLISRYMDYTIDKTTKKFVSGINDHRIEKHNYMTFEKRIDYKDQSISRKCPSCGANIDVNSNGKCTYCDTIYNFSDYEWILTSIETL